MVRQALDSTAIDGEDLVAFEKYGLNKTILVASRLIPFKSIGYPDVT